jgi:two-component system response regulator
MIDLNAVELLIVEDSPQDAELTVRALKEQNLTKYIYIVEDGAEALDFIFCRGNYSERDPHRMVKVVFLDLKLPKLNGFEVLKKIRTDQRTKMLPVVIVTSSSEEYDIRTAYELGANSYVVKPVEFDAFCQAMDSTAFFWLQINQPPKE